MECNNCLCNLERCKAECCKLFVIRAIPHIVYHRGTRIKLIVNDEDLKLYYRLHNCYVEGDVVFIRLNMFKVVGHRLFVYERCQYLDEENHCKHHADGMQPKICAYPNKDGIGENIYLTPNCVYGREKK